MGTTQHSQKENSQAEKISLRAFRSQRGMLGEGSTEIDNLQAETSAQKLPLPTGEGWGEGSTFNSATGKQLQELNKINCHAESKFSEGRRVSVANPARKLWQNHVFDTTRIISSISASSHHQVITTPEKQSDHAEISPVARFRNKFGMTSPSKGMSAAKVEQQSTETLSFRCWCEGCRLTRGRRVKQKKVAFTLAEVLITLGIVGVVAALTLPALLTNVQSKIRGEQKRSVKYKFSLATEKMARLNLIGPYDSTDAFVDELQKHLKISKRCNASNLRGCWPYDTVDLGDGKTWDISKTKTGKELGMETTATQDYSSNNVGIVTADGTPMILSYNKKCEAIDSLKRLSWSAPDGKPESNESANCVAAVFEINGTGKPNKLSDDVVLFNANKLGSGCAFEVNWKCFGAPFTPSYLTKAECEAEKGNLGIKECEYDTDYWAGAVKQCGGVSKMPTMDDLGMLASQLYKGNPRIRAYQRKWGLQWDQDAATALGFTSSGFKLWSDEENSSYGAYSRTFDSTEANYYDTYRSYSPVQAVCLGE